MLSIAKIHGHVLLALHCRLQRPWDLEKKPKDKTIKIIEKTVLLLE